MTGANRLDETFAALAHPARRAMLARLAQGEATVTELAEPFDMSLPAVSKHVRVLERAGLISQAKSAQYRPCRLNAAPIRDVASWVEAYRHIWEARFDALSEALATIKEADDDG